MGLGASKPARASTDVDPGAINIYGVSDLPFKARIEAKTTLNITTSPSDVTTIPYI
ncbi:MAG TPA: hypothetical protein VIL99_16240 [Ignavibacteria bacterium]